MSSRLRHAMCGVLATSAILATAGCSGDAVTGGSTALALNVTPNPGGVGRFEEASDILVKVQVLPADPAAAALYGTDSLILFFTPKSLDLTTNQDVFISNIALSTGTYRVSFLDIDPLVLVDNDVSPTPATCIDGIAVIDSSHAPGVPASFPFTNPNLTFTVRPGQTKLSIKINIPGLIAGYESAFTCQLGCGPGGSPCLTAFDEPTYRAAILANLQFE